MGVESKPTLVIVSKDLDLAVGGSYKTNLFSIAEIDPASTFSTNFFTRPIIKGKNIALPLSIEFDDPSLASATINATGTSITFLPLKSKGTTSYLLIDANGVSHDKKVLQIGGPYDFEQPKELTLKVGESRVIETTWPDLAAFTTDPLYFQLQSLNSGLLMTPSISTSDTLLAPIVAGKTPGVDEFYWLVIGGDYSGAVVVVPWPDAPTIKVTIVE